MVSERRNEVLAEIFHRVKMVEKWGRGITKILSKEPDAVFKEVGTHFIVVFRRKTTGGFPLVTREKTREETREKTREIIIRLILNNSKITTDELAKQAGLTAKGIEWNIKKLRAEGIIKRVGPKKGGHWEITDTTSKTDTTTTT
jgi:ATP-dependent DNA helicase RecG